MPKKMMVKPETFATNALNHMNLRELTFYRHQDKCMESMFENERNRIRINDQY